MRIISRDEARSLGLTRFFTGVPCRNGHIAEKNTKGGYCVRCNIKSVKKYQDNTEYKLPPEYFSEWRDRNKDKLPLYDKRRSKSWLAEKAARRRVSQPRCLSKAHIEKMREIYEHSRDCSIATGERYVVDHIIPIKGKTVSGLHVPWNLQVLPEYVNRRKHNHLLEF